MVCISLLTGAPYTDPSLGQRSFSPNVVKGDSQKWVCQKSWFRGVCCFVFYLLDRHLIPKVHIFFVACWNCR